MIFDRTAKDVSEAINIRRNKIQKNIELTDEDIRKLEKGSITLSTINRISQKIIDLDAEISEMSYLNGSVSAKIWGENDFFMLDDFKRLTDDTARLKKRFMVFTTTPADPRPEYHYRELNLMEKILYDLDIMVQSVKSYYKQCGNYECGE